MTKNVILNLFQYLTNLAITRPAGQTLNTHNHRKDSKTDASE